MHQAKRWRYYCDFCGKAGGSKYHMERHEASCTNNPNRVCRLCDVIGDETTAEDLAMMVSIIKENAIDPVDDLEFSTTKEASVMKKLREITECPACLLAAIRQSGVPYLFESFDYKKERDSLWEEVRREEMDSIAF